MALPRRETNVTQLMGSGADRAAVLPAVVAQAQRGDREAFGYIFDTFHLQVYRYVLVRVRNEADAEDIAAETFHATFRAIGRFRWRGVPFEAWLFRIARSKIIDHQRRLARRPPPSDIDAVPEAGLPLAGDIEAEVVGRDEQQRVMALVPTLSQDQQDVIAMRFFAGLSVEETGAAMGRSAGAVKQLQFRAVSALRERMEAGS